METSTILTVIGIIVSLLIGGSGIYLILKQRYPGQITFVKETSLGLFDSIIKNLPELSVLYKEKPVSPGLVLLKGALLNTGSKDITEDMVEEKLSFSLPENFKWLTAKVVSTSPKIQAKIRVSANRITFDTGLFRCSEYIRFEALVEEVPIPEGAAERDTGNIEQKLGKALEITHRIADTQKVKVRKLPDITKSAKELISNIILPITIIMVLGLIPVMFHFTGWPAQTNFLITTDDNKTIKVSIQPRLNGTVKVKGVDQKYEEIVDVSDFFQKRGLTPKIESVEPFKLILIVLLPLLFISIALTLSSYIGHKKARKLHKLLSIRVENASG